MILGLLTLSPLASAAPCTPWISCPVAADLHPVRADLGVDYQRALERTMAGRRSSPLFSATLNEAEAHWRLLAATDRGLPLTAADATAWRDLALAGSFLSFDRVIGETVSRSEEAAAFRTAADTFVSPSVEVVVPAGGRPVRVGHPSGWGVYQRFQRQEEESDLDVESAPPIRPGAARERQPPLKIGAAVGWKLRDLDAPAEAPILTWNANVSIHNALFSLWRVDVDLMRLHWDALVRERLFDGVSVGLGAHSAEGDPTPTRWSAGLSWRPRPTWVVTATRNAALDGSFERYELSLRVELGTFLPGRLDPSLAGLPAVPDLSPNRLVSPVATPALPAAPPPRPPTSACGARRSSGTGRTCPS